MEEKKGWKKRLTGRPKLAHEELKQHRITMLFTDKEFNEIKRRAEIAGVRPAAYSESVILRTKMFYSVNPREMFNAMKAVAKEINPIGNNLNQLARHANVSYKSGVVDRETFVEMNKLIEQFLELQKVHSNLVLKLIKTRK